jgi:cytoskeletal protein RodZ
VVVLVLEPTQVPTATRLLPAVEVPVPSPAVEVQGPPLTAEVAESSSARVSLTVEEMMDLETCWYIDFPGVGVIDLEAA